MPRTVREFLAVTVPAAVHPVLEELLADDERASVSLRVVDWDQVLLRPDTVIRSSWALLSITVRSEVVAIGLEDDEPDEEFRARLRSDLQDFIAESRFGWGELRG